MIRKAIEKDIDSVEKSYTELLEYEKEKGGYSNWVLGLYPTRETAQRAFDENSLYVLECDGEICASIILNHLQPDDYGKINWKYEADKKEVLVIHTLCIPPSKAGKGLGKKMIEFAVNKAVELNCKVIRLDTYAGNTPAANLYKSKGFVYAGKADVMLQGVIPEEQIFFEIKL